VAYTYDRASGRYRDSSGRYLSERAVRDAVDNLADLSSARIADLTTRLQSGGLQLADWQQQMMAEMKAAHVAAGVAAHGGRQQMAPADWGAVGRRLRDQYGYLREFAAQIADGRQPLDGRLVARARLYGQASRSTFEAIRARDDKARGMTVEQNVLHGSDHCLQCPGLSARGWVPIGSLPMIGERQCGQNDRCTITRRLAAPEPA
jgi:hypothetical protein